MTKRHPASLRVSKDHIFVYSNLGSTKIKKIGIELHPLGNPVLKWAGGKQWLATAARHLTPVGWNGKYYEPFFGGGSFFFAIGPKRALLTDKNEELISTYKVLQNDSRGMIRLLRSYPYNKKFYYRLRKRVPKASRLIAARFIYLNRTCWNGLYRVNQQGKFNTPFGNFNNRTICDTERILAASKLLRGISLGVGDFDSIEAKICPGDFVYFDPPYVTGHQNNGFLKYNSQLFSWGDQERLANLAIRLAKLNVNVLVSNSDYPAVVDLYKGFNYYRIRRQSLIGGQITSRGKISEALLSNYQLLETATEVI